MTWTHSPDFNKGGSRGQSALDVGCFPPIFNSRAGPKDAGPARDAFAPMVPDGHVALGISMAEHLMSASPPLHAPKAAGLVQESSDSRVGAEAAV